MVTEPLIARLKVRLSKTIYVGVYTRDSLGGAGPLSVQVESLTWFFLFFVYSSVCDDSSVMHEHVYCVCDVLTAGLHCTTTESFLGPYFWKQNLNEAHYIGEGAHSACNLRLK